MKAALALALVALATCQDYRAQGQDWTGTCANGLSQSPINFREVPQDPKDMVYVTAANSTYTPLRFNYPEQTDYVAEQTATTFQVYNLEGTLQAVRIGETVPTTFTLNRIVFHAPAEHLWNGARYPLEMRLGHVSEAGEQAILGVWFVRSPQRSPFLDAILNGQPARLSELGDVCQEYYFYMGSLTYPPCVEGISWYIPRLGYRNALPASPDQISFFQNMWARNPDFAGGFGNNRLDQLINERYVYHFIPTPETESFLQ